jgi:biotin-dependent carboxylase-like uncharacterized protein
MIEVLQPGQYSSIQDLGRFGYRKLGVPLSGAMDQNSAKVANLLVGNELNAAILEMTLVGSSLHFHRPAILAFSGAKCQISLNGEMISMNEVHHIKVNSILKCGPISEGMYTYLAIKGGFISEKILGSASYFNGITPQIRLQKGQELNFDPKAQILPRATTIEPKTITSLREIDVYPGPEFDSLPPKMKELLFETQFTISNQSNRMGYRLNSTAELTASEIITSPVQPGTVQLTPSGQLVVLMRDAQTTGGYARIFQLTAKSINQFAQKRVGEEVIFALNHS